MKLPAWTLRLILNCWPPFLGAGIHVKEIKPDFSFARVTLAFRWYTKNYMRTQFGGSLYTMTDPFFALMLMMRLGSNYLIWDKYGEINYIKPGRKRVYADFVITEEQLETIRVEVHTSGKALSVFVTELYDEEEQLIAKVKKTIYIATKDYVAAKENALLKKQNPSKRLFGKG